MLTNSKAIVLHTTKYGETKLFVDLFSELYGRMTMVALTGSRNRKKNRSNYFQPLSIIEVEFDLRPGVSMQTIKEVRIATPLASIQFNPYKLSISIFIAEFMLHSLKNEQTDYRLFSYIENSIIWLDSANKDYSNFHLIFMTHISHLLGISPNMESFSPGCIFDMREGCFTMLLPTHSDVLKTDESAVLNLLMRLNYRTMRLLKLSHTERNRCTAGILKYYRLHIPNFPELKSFSIMQELFS